MICEEIVNVWSGYAQQALISVGELVQIKPVKALRTAEHYPITINQGVPQFLILRATGESCMWVSGGYRKGVASR